MFDPRTLLLMAAALVCAAANAGDSLRDPMRPDHAQAATPAQAQRFRVSAIFLSDVRRVAILNGRTVTVGDRVDGATVTAIGDNTVRLAYQGRAISAILKTARIRQ